MPSLLDTQRQIAKYVDYPARFLENRDIKLLSSFLFKEEEVRKIIMTYNGLLVATNKRIFFHLAEEVKSFFYKEISAVEFTLGSFIFPSFWIYLYISLKKYSFRCYAKCSGKKEVEQFCNYVKEKIFTDYDNKEFLEKEKKCINSKIVKTSINVNKTGKILKAIGLFLLIWIFGGILLSFIFGRISGAIAFIVGIIVAIKFYKKNNL